jgi:hypothetical protein
MKRVSFLLLIIVALITPPAINAYAAEPILSCESSTSGPTSGAAKGELLTATATMLGNAISVTTSRWEPNDGSLTGSLTYYFVYAREVGKSSWKCTNSISQYITVGSINSAINHDVAIVAYRGGWWSNIVNIVLPAGANNKRQACIPESKFLSGLSGEGQPSKSDYQVNAYSKNSNRFSLMLANDKDDPKAEGVIYRSRYIVEYSIDNWKTKAKVRSSMGYNLVSFTALSRTKAHKVRAYEDVSSLSAYVQNWVPDPKHSKLGEWGNTNQKIEFTTEGCKSIDAIFYPKVVKESSDICDSYDSNCAVVLIPGENADIEANTEEKTIKCTKGKLVKNVTSTKPKCPAGYKVSK